MVAEACQGGACAIAQRRREAPLMPCRGLVEPDGGREDRDRTRPPRLLRLDQADGSAELAERRGDQPGRRRAAIRSATRPCTGECAHAAAMSGSRAEVSGRYYAPSGARHHQRPLKRRSPEEVRSVPIPPVLVAIVRDHPPSSGRRLTAACSSASRTARTSRPPSTLGSGSTPARSACPGPGRLAAPTTTGPSQTTGPACGTVPAGQSGILAGRTS